MKRYLFLTLILLNLLNSCNNYLPGFDFALFKNTKAFKLSIAVKNENTQEIERLIANDSSLIDYKDPKFGHSLLMLSVANNLEESTAKLLELGSNPNLKSQPSSTVNSEITTPMFIACNQTYSSDCDTNILELLVKHGGNIEDEISVKYVNADYMTKETPLMEATKHDCINVVRKLINLGADINKYDYLNGKGPLSNCIIYDNMEALEFLVIDKKAKIPKYVYVRSAYGNQPRQELSLIEFLDEQNYSKNSKNYILKNKIISYLQR